jgi:hypothetical protein
MTVYVAHAPADRAAAEALERVIERRGQFVELDDGQTALRPVEANDVLVLMASRALNLATARLRLEQRALDAWAGGRLVVVKLDDEPAPVGLRDLPTIDACAEDEREQAWQEVAEAVQQKVRPASVTAHEAKPARGGGVLGLAALAAAAAPGLVAIAAVASIWLVNRIGPSPGGWPELRRGVDQFGTRFGIASGVTEWLFLIAIAVTAGVTALFVARLFKRSSAAVATQASAQRSSEAMFVSYARANAPVVLPVIEAAKRAGRKFWLDQRSSGAGSAPAGELIRPISAAGGVIVMCSKAAFESDHVKREIYLADRYRKKLVPVFIEEAQPPEDFEYFFAGAESLKLFETPEAERPQALVRVIGAA